MHCDTGVAGTHEQHVAYAGGRWKRTAEDALIASNVLSRETGPAVAVGVAVGATDGAADGPGRRNAVMDIAAAPPLRPSGDTGASARPSAMPPPLRERAARARRSA
jgi:hypothetical protein